MGAAIAIAQLLHPPTVAPTPEISCSSVEEEVSCLLVFFFCEIKFLQMDTVSSNPDIFSLVKEEEEVCFRLSRSYTYFFSLQRRQICVL